MGENKLFDSPYTVGSFVYSPTLLECFDFSPLAKHSPYLNFPPWVGGEAHRVVGIKPLLCLC